MIIITIGEIIIAAFIQTLAASFASENKRGRYMAIYSYAYILPSLFGVLAAGLIMDIEPNWVWYLGGIIASFTVFAYLILLKFWHHSKEGKSSSEDHSHIQNEIPFD